MWSVNPFFQRGLGIVLFRDEGGQRAQMSLPGYEKSLTEWSREQEARLRPEGEKAREVIPERCWESRRRGAIGEEGRGQEWKKRVACPLEEMRCSPSQSHPMQHTPSPRSEGVATPSSASTIATPLLPPPRPPKLRPFPIFVLCWAHLDRVYLCSPPPSSAPITKMAGNVFEKWQRKDPIF